ncbi:MAG: phenylalanine--tRNA ligase subunit alpha [Firmicutes bacterium]|nr:phenylalanine--tRNA ligase subunit alpha [Bacillota bacterium]
MLSKISQLREEAMAAIAEADSQERLDKVRVQYLGKKGELTALLRGLGQVDPQQRPVIGQAVNSLRADLEQALADKGAVLAEQEQAARLAKEKIDITLPGRRPQIGTFHPLTIVLREIQEIFLGMGYEVAEGPEVETDYYNFEALNIPAEHPARDMWDTLYTAGNTLLRTHTSPVQVRTMERMQPQVPIKIIAPGRVYRRDALDASHSPVFNQVEGLVVDRGITFADLKGTLVLFVQKMFGKDRQVRFRPSFFPFTEPSAEVDVSCIVCNGAGCRLCSQTGWLEILGAGSVHPRVLEMSGYDPTVYSGFAFGLGVDRIALLKYGIDDIRHLYENNWSFLKQFRTE